MYITMLKQFNDKDTRMWRTEAGMRDLIYLHNMGTQSHRYKYVDRNHDSASVVLGCEGSADIESFAATSRTGSTTTFSFSSSIAGTLA